MISKVINLKIKEQVNVILSKETLNNEQCELKTLSDFISALIVVHIKYWQFEDNIEEIESLATIGKLKQETNSLFKIERPELIKSIDGIIIELLKGGQISETQQCSLTSSIPSYIHEMKSGDNFDLLYSDTLSELIDKIVIIQIRRWHIKSSLLSNQSNDISLKLKIIDEEKIPMLVKCLDKLFVLMATGRVDFIPINVKFYNGVNK
jgi:hypothetical protein